MRSISLRPLLVASALALPALLCRPAEAQRGKTVIVGFRSDVARSEHPVSASPEELTAALKQAYAQLQLPLMQSSENPADLFTPYLRVRRQLFGHNNSEFFACQEQDVAGNMADRAEVVFAVLNRVRPAANGTAVLLTQVDARAARRDVAANAVECATTGALEKALQEVVDGVLYAPAASASPPAPAPAP